MQEGLQKTQFPKERFLINGAMVDAVDVKPKILKDEVPVLVAPGWGATGIESFGPGLEVLAQRGRRAISLDHPRQGGVVPESHNKEIEEWYKKRGEKYPTWPDVELRKAGTILGIIDQKGIEKIDVIAHSEGAINTCIAAMHHPEKFRTLVLCSPAGLIGKDSLLRLNKGATENNAKRPDSISRIPVTEAETEYLKSTKHITPDYMSENYPRAFMETLAIAQAQIEDMLRYLHEKGIEIIVMAAGDDTFFPMSRLQKNVKSKGVPDGFVDGLVSVIGGHMQLQTHPEKFMAAAESLLTQPKEKTEEKI